MEGQIENMKKEYQRKVENCFENLQQAAEDSYNNIDEALDEVLNDQSNYFDLECMSTLSQQDSIQIQSNCLLNHNFQNYLIQEVNSLINNLIQSKHKLFKSNHQDIQQLNIQQTIQQPSNTQPILKPFTYQLINQNSIKYDQYCYAIAINKDCSILVAGCYKEIKVFEFNQGIIKQIQILNEHNGDVTTLNFMKRSNNFISGSFDYSIIIWARNQNNSWISQYKLIGHTSFINCLVLNNNEDVIVSSGYDKSIKFWVKDNQWKCSQTITDHTKSVYGLSLNELQNRVISCGDDKFILVIEQSEQNKQWQVIQKIKVEQSGYRICFIDNITFTFQPVNSEYMHVYEINETNKQYIKTNDIQVRGNQNSNTLFPQQFIKQKCILVNKHDSNVNLIRKNQNGKFIIEESIQFQTRRIYGCMSDDGQYLITWDQKSREYQIRKYKET